MEISSNLGSERNYKNGHEIKEKQNETCRWLISYNVGQSLFPPWPWQGGRAMYLWQREGEGGLYAVRLSTSGSHIPSGRGNKSCQGIRIWWERGSGSWLVSAGAGEFRCYGSAVRWHQRHHQQVDWLAGVEWSKECISVAPWGWKKEHWGYTLARWLVWLKI